MTELVNYEDGEQLSCKLALTTAWRATDASDHNAPALLGQG